MGEEYSSILLYLKYGLISVVPYKKNDLFWVGEEYSSILLYLKYGLIKSSGLIRRMTSFEWGRNTVVFYYIWSMVW